MPEATTLPQYPEAAGTEGRVTTPDACVAFVDRVGICSWRGLDRFPNFPSLEDATPWGGSEVTLKTWFWKDDLHIARRLYYGQNLGNGGTPAFVSLALLPVLIAAAGDNDPRTLYEKGRLSQMALVLYEHIERSGPTATSLLPWRPGSRQIHLAALQQAFLITKHGLTGRTRGTYGYLWGRCEDHFPDAFAQAARIPVTDARERILTHLAGQGVRLTYEQAAKLFRWHED
jgi:hypothetical protein